MIPAHEYRDDADVLEAKIAALAELLQQSKFTVAYTGPSTQKRKKKKKEEVEDAPIRTSTQRKRKKGKINRPVHEKGKGKIRKRTRQDKEGEDTSVHPHRMMQIAEGGRNPREEWPVLG
jgi:hypothetical protein